MKRLMSGLVAVAFVGAVQAASTDTVTAPPEYKVVELHLFKNTKVADTKSKKKNENILPVGHGTCSGAFINSLGDIITARHCVEDDTTIEVKTYDQRTYKATVIATSTVHDLALIHVDRRNTPYFELADHVSKGEWIFILGSPLAISDSLSTGIVSRIDGDETFLDCSVLPGNSGGPVFDGEGKLVGVVTAVHVVMLGLTHSGIIQGIDAVDYFIQETMEKRYGFGQ